ncbi:LEF-3 [Spodoptera litura nucleopolyhedrovirus II]|uniref:LEF-3 n=1 Tax=Spodoptera litura nucleopolyhedrovirus II TaxID=566270 RepID=UPI00018745FA|nr:LEF-3 [Spodoptera litura nucleopolyhedrovirus II]ACI47462.1 LEF-3 [Spodoptera litura nucleopolyhedrovirus II]
MSFSKNIDFENEMKRPRHDSSSSMDGNASSSSKRPRYSNNQSSPTKRLSNGSTTSVESVSKKIPKSVTGQLVTKNMYCVNNEAFYLFKFLVDNVPKNYYGNNNMFQSLKCDHMYELELVYENKRLAIAKATQCKNTEKIIMVKRYVEPIDFDGEDTITVGAKLKFGFKLIDNDSYKAVFIINHGDDLDSSCPVQIECMGNLKRWAASIKDENIIDENSLLEYFNERRDTMFNLYRIKCQQSNGNYKNFSLQNITQISSMAEPEFEIDEDEDNVTNISRLNKRVVHGLVNKVNVERQSEDRFSISYQVVNDDEWIRGSFFIKNQQYNDKRNDKMERLEKLETDLNQLNDLIEGEILKVEIYVAVDIGSKNCNVLGLTKIENEANDRVTFEGI